MVQFQCVEISILQCVTAEVTPSGTVSRGKTAVLLDFVQMRGGGALHKFVGTFSEVHFWSIKGVYFLQNANNLFFKLFFRLYIYSIIYSAYSIF